MHHAATSVACRAYPRFCYEHGAFLAAVRGNYDLRVSCDSAVRWMAANVPAQTLVELRSTGRGHSKRCALLKRARVEMLDGVAVQKTRPTAQG